MGFGICCNFLKDYFGILMVPLFLAIILDFLFIFIKDKNRKSRYRVRLLCTIIFIIVGIVIFLLKTMSYNSTIAEGALIEKSIMTYNLGFLMTYFIVFLFNNFKLDHIFLVGGILLFISSFFLFGKMVSNFIKYLIKLKNKRKAKKLERALMQQMEAQLAIKEELEKKRAEEYMKQNMVLANRIKERVELAREEKSLPFEESNKEEKEEK